MLNTAEQYYRALGVEPGASPEEVHQGYLDMTWVWHPDRFVGHPRLQQKAHHKLQQLNEAHERLRSFQATSLTQDFRTKPKSHVAPASYYQPSTERLYQPQVKRASGESNKKTTQENKPSRSSTRRELDAWLD